MTNEGLKFGALALGIALVILIIVLVVRGHKDKYEPGNVGTQEKGCCSVLNNTACGTGEGNPYTEKTGCGDEELTFEFNLKTYNNFNGEIQFELLDYPTQISYNISPTSLNSSGTLGSIALNRNELPYGTYNILLNGTHDNITEEESFVVSFYPDTVFSPNLLSPDNNLSDANINQNFEWSNVNYADNYRFELSTVEDFSSLVKSIPAIRVLPPSARTSKSNGNSFSFPSFLIKIFFESLKFFTFSNLVLKKI